MWWLRPMPSVHIERLMENMHYRNGAEQHARGGTSGGYGRDRGLCTPMHEFDVIIRVMDIALNSARAFMSFCMRIPVFLPSRRVLRLWRQAA